MTKSIDNPLSSVTTSLKALSAKAKDLRTKADAIKSEIRALNDAPVSLADFAKYLRSYVNTRAEVYENSLWLHGLHETKAGADRTLRDTPFSEFERVSSLSAFRPLPSMSEAHMNRGSTFDAFCFFMPETVFEKLYSAIQNGAGRNWGHTEEMPVEQRIEVIKSLTAELEKLQPQVNAAESEMEEISTLISDASR